MKILFIILVGFIGLNANAVTTISNVTNASNSVDLTTTTAIEIMAGISGASQCAADTGTIDSCALAANRAACNLKTVCPTTILKITLTSAATGTINLIDEDKNIVETCGSYTANETKTCEFAWGDICNEVTADSTCATTTGSKTLQIGVNNAGDNTLEDGVSITLSVVGIQNTAANESLNSGDDGVDNYTLFPGDEKGYVTEFSAIQDYTVSEAADIVGLVGFSTEATCATPLAVTTAAPISPLSIDDDSKEITDNRVNDLENGRTYLFMFGFQDEAGNIGLFKDLTADCVNDQHTVTPREVSGLLEDNQNCFISTAAFGSPLNSKVKTFRKFRDEILSHFSLGKMFIEFYYKNSPPIADQIRKSKVLRSVTRALLWPAWAISASVLYMGLMPFLFVVTMTLLSFVFLRNKSTKKKLLVLFLIFSAQTSQAQEDFFSTGESEKAAPAPVETAPTEPPYTGNENDEFSNGDESIQAEEDYEPEIEANTESKITPSQSKSFDSASEENPNKWKPYQSIPDEKRLEELSNEGLIKITKKGGYNYKVEPSEQKSAASFRFGAASFPNLQNPTNDTFFTDIYDTNKKPVLLVDYERQFFKSFGKLGIKIGSGLMVASGQGQFATPFTPPATGIPTTDAEEKYNFYMFPNSLALIYRLDIFNRQWVVPFAEAGVDYLAFIEARDDGEDIKFGGSPHFHFAIGGSFLLDNLGKDMMTEIDKQYGVNHLWLTAEYRHLEALGSDFDFSDDLISAGLMVEF